MPKHFLHYRRNISNSWLALGFACFGITIFILVVSVTMGGIQSIIPSIWLSIPITILVGSLVHTLFSRIQARWILSILGLIMIATWFFTSTGVRQLAAVVVLPERYGINIAAMIGIILLSACSIDYFVAHPNFAVILIAVIFLNRIQAWLTTSSNQSFNSTINLLLALYVVVIYVTIGSVVVYEFLAFLFHEFYTPKRNIFHEE